MGFYDGNKDGKHYWLTPPELMANLHSEWKGGRRMPEKINAFVCDDCRICVGKGVDGYPIDNGWEVINDNGTVRCLCPKCAREAKDIYDAEKCL